MVTVQQAWAHILARAKRLAAEVVPLDEAGHRVLAEALRAPMAVPPFDNSAMDGFAVREEDIRGAAAGAPVRLHAVATIAAGQTWRGPLRAGQAVRIMTGAALPRGADTVVRQEDTRAGEGWVDVLAAKPRGEAVRRRGSDLRQGQVALARDTELGPAELSLIASLGIPKVRVTRRPRVALIASGSELRPPGKRLRPGEIHESSHWALAGILRAAGAEVTWLGIAPDERAATRRLISRGLRHDVLVTAGGVSVGAFDYVRDELRASGAREVFWQVAQRPGKPLLFAVAGKTLVFGLPGNPVSSVVSAHLYVCPALRRMRGLREVFPPRLRLPLATPVSQPATLHTFHRVSFAVKSGRVWVSPTTENQGSGVFSSMIAAHGLTSLPPGADVHRAGEEIDVLVLDTAALARAVAEASHGA